MEHAPEAKKPEPHKPETGKPSPFWQKVKVCAGIGLALGVVFGPLAVPAGGIAAALTMGAMGAVVGAGFGGLLEATQHVGRTFAKSAPHPHENGPHVPSLEHKPVPEPVPVKAHAPQHHPQRIHLPKIPHFHHKPKTQDNNVAKAAHDTHGKKDPHKGK